MMRAARQFSRCHHHRVCGCMSGWLYEGRTFMLFTFMFMFMCELMLPMGVIELIELIEE